MNASSRPSGVGFGHAPIFFSFFTWGFGTGAQNLGRPLFALAATGNVFLVGVLLAMNAVPRSFTGPLTGWMADRFGRKPLVMLGPTIRGLSNVGQFLTDDYWVFLGLEAVGQVGVSMWNTSSNVLLSDVTRTETRGRVLALRQMSTRMGFVAGPAVGGLLAAVYGIQSVFLLNAISKIVIVLVVFFMVKETQPEELRAPRARFERRSFSLAPFRSRTFVVLAIATAIFAMSNAGIMQTLVPVYAIDEVHVDEAAVGFLLSLSSTFAFIFAFPNGMIADRFGRKWSLVPGLLLTSAASLVLAVGDVYGTLLLAVSLKGFAEAMAMGTTQTYAMDLAPPESRGTFMGVWTLAQSIGGMLGPVVLAGLYYYLFPDVAFYAMAVIPLLGALALAVFAKETGGRAGMSAGPAEGQN